MQQSLRLTISDLDVQAVNMPMQVPPQRRSGTVGTALLALLDLLDLRTAQDVVGMALAGTGWSWHRDRAERGSGGTVPRGPVSTPARNRRFKALHP